MVTNKEIKEEYKNRKSKKGVFQIRNLVNGKIFISSSLDLDAIWNRHRTQLKFGIHPNQQLQQDWKQFGVEKFVFEILIEIKEEDGKNINYDKEVKQLEQLFIEDKTPFGEKGYNKKTAKN